MLGQIVDYLHDARVPFHLASYPSEESLPAPAHRVPPGGVLVDTRLFVADGRTVLAVFPHDESVTPASVLSALGTSNVLDATNDELPGEFRRADGPVPPLGQLFGIPVVLDQRAAGAAILVFCAFSRCDFVEVPYDDYARLEQPRLASFASAGELGTGAPARDR